MDPTRDSKGDRSERPGPPVVPHVQRTQHGASLELIERLHNGHDPSVLTEFTSNPAVIGSGTALVTAFPDLVADVQWVVAEDDMVVVFHRVSGTQQGPWLFVQQPTGRPMETSFMFAFRFDDDGQIIDQWLGSNFVEMLTQLGWGFAPRGSVVE